MPSRTMRLLSVMLFGPAILAAGCTPDDGGPVTVDEVVTDVQYYYACGNEILILPDGRRFYPLPEQSDIDESRYADDAVQALTGDILAVAPPGPGDDTGTLTICDDGVAHWESESGITAWLGDEEREFDWIC